MIRGMHAMFCSSQAEALRTFIRDKLGLKGVDVGQGWLIFYCDDIGATVKDLTSRGVEFVHPVEDHGYGLVAEK